RSAAGEGLCPLAPRERADTPLTPSLSPLARGEGEGGLRRRCWRRLFRGASDVLADLGSVHALEAHGGYGAAFLGEILAAHLRGEHDQRSDRGRGHAGRHAQSAHGDEADRYVLRNILVRVGFWGSRGLVRAVAVESQLLAGFDQGRLADAIG